jgi:hypothetical protein
MFGQHLVTVRWETRIVEGHGLELRVFGPGSLRRSYAFQDVKSLVDYQVQFEHQLVTTGYDVMPRNERRSGRDRRRLQRPIEDRRKQ